MKIKVLVFILLVSVFSTIGCQAGMSGVIEKEEITYYASFGGYSIPLKPVEEISKEDAMSRDSYCIGYYDTKGKLSRFEKYLRGSLFFRHEYSYYDNGVIKQDKVLNADGVEKINVFDEKGNPKK